MSITCNICNSTTFQQHKTRSNARCQECRSVEYHRAVYQVLIDKDLIKADGSNRYCLHLAPEHSLYNVLRTKYLYVAADLFPDEYRFVDSIVFKLDLSRDLRKMPSDRFDLIIHNHVLEHVPGDFRDHIRGLHRIMSKSGTMIFTLPDDRIKDNLEPTIDGGEFLTDNERLLLHGHEDHCKSFGTDMVDFLRSTFETVELLLDPRDPGSELFRKKHNALGIVFYCRK